MAIPTSGLILHLEAEDLTATLADNDPVALWPDRSAAGNDAFQATGTAQPILKTAILNGLAVVRFDGLTDALSLPDLFNDVSATAGEIFIVVKIANDPPAIVNSTGLWRFGTAGMSGHYPWQDSFIYEEFGSTTRHTTVNPAQTLAVFNLYNVSSATNDLKTRLNGTQIFAAVSNTVAWSATPSIGGAPSFGWWCDGDIAGVIAFSRVLDVAERGDVEDYVDARWFTAPPTAPANPAATATSASTITVDWDDVADETGFRVERSLNGTTGWVDVSGTLAAGTVTFGDTGLAAATEYFYRVFALSAAGDSPPSDVVSATTDSGPPTPSSDEFCCNGFDCLTRDPFACTF